MNLTEQLNNAINQKQILENTIDAAATDLSTSSNTLSLGLKPSEYLPIRTARYWQDVEMSNFPNISFYTSKTDEATKDITWEVHRNATESFGTYVDISALHQVLKETSFELSLRGESDIASFKIDDPILGKKIVPLKIALIRKSYFPDGSLKYYHGITNLNQGTAPWIVTYVFRYNSENEVVVQNKPYQQVTNQETGELYWDEMSVESFNEKYKQELQGEIKYGKVPFPVVTLTNTGADRNGSGTNDTDEVIDILARLDIVEDAIDRSIKTAKTRLFNKRKNGALSLGNKTASSNNSVVQQIGDDVEVITLVEDPHAGEGLMNGVQVSDRRLDVSDWYSVRTKLLQEYYSHTGENVEADAHGNNQHTYEVQSRGDNKYRRATAKKTQRAAEIKALVTIIIAVGKTMKITKFIGVENINVGINEVDIRNEYEKDKKIETLKKLGLISDVQAIMELKGWDEIPAINWLLDKQRHDKIAAGLKPIVSRETIPPAVNPPAPDGTTDPLGTEEEIAND